MTKPFKRIIEKTEWGHYVMYKVHGFWSGTTIRVSKHKNWQGEWEPADISWSTGGRDGKETESNLEAAECFAQALLDAIELAKQLDAKPEETL